MKYRFKIDKIYSASDITNDKFYGIYDKYIALVDNELQHLDGWIWDSTEEYMNEDKSLSEEEAYNEALESIINDIGICYEDAKNIAVFSGIPPYTDGRGFDIYTEYKCISNESVDK